MFRSLRFRMTAVFVGLAIGPLILAAAIVEYRSFSSLEQQSVSLQRELTARVAGELRVFVEARENELKYLNAAQQLAILAPEEQRGILGSLLLHQQVYQEIVLVDVDGQEQIRVSRDGSGLDADLEYWADVEAFIFPITHGEFYFGPVRFDEDNREPLMILSVPIVDLRSGDVVFVLVADLRFKPIWDLLARIELSDAGDVYVTDQTGRVVAHKDPTIVLRNTTVDIPVRDGRAKGLTGTEVFAAQKVLQLGNQEFIIIAEQPVSIALKLAYDTLQVTVAATLIALTSVGILVVFSVRQIVRPIEVMTRAAQAIGRGDFSRQISVSTRDEVYELGSALNSMSYQLQKLMTGLQREITERVQAEVALRESEARYRSLFEDSPISLWEEDWTEVKQYIDSLRDLGICNLREYFEDHPEVVPHCARLVKILDVNQATLELYGARRKEDLQGEGLEPVFTEEALDVFREEVMALVGNETLFETELIEQTLTGSTLYTAVRLAVAPSYEETWSKIFVSVIDISARKRAEEQRLALAGERERVRLLADFITDISHEFSTPLSIINTRLYLLEKSPDHEKRMELFAVINEQLVYIGNLVEAMLMMMRLDSGRGQMNFRSLDINKILRNIETQVHASVQAKQQSFSLHFTPDLPSIQADEQQLHRALREFVKNGIQFTPEGGTITVKTAASEGVIVVEIMDTGIGIGEEHIPHIFDHFFRADKARTTRGAGLGLPIAKKIIDIHQGSIEVHSKLGSGSTFRILLQASTE